MEMTQTELAGLHSDTASAMALLDGGKSDDRTGRLSPPPSPLLLPFKPDAALAAPGAQPGTANGSSPLALAVCGANGVDWRTYAQCLRRADPGPWADILTRPEARVAACLLVSHADEKEIAKAFPIRCSTVHHYLVGIYEKPGVHNLENARRELRRRI